MASLQTRLTVIIIGLAVGPLLVLCAMISWQAYRVQKSQAIALEKETALRVGIEVEKFVQGLVNQLETGLIAMSQGETTLPRREMILANILSGHSYYDRLILVDLNGQEIIHQSRLDLITPDQLKNVSDLPEFQKPMATGSVYYGPIEFDPLTGEPFMIISIPLINPRSGSATATLIAHTRWKKIWILFSSMAQRPGEDIYLLDRKGRLVAHRNPSLVLRKTIYKPRSFNGIDLGFHGDKVIRAVEKLTLGDQSFMVVAEQSLREAFSLAISTMLITSVLIATLLVIAVTLIILVVRSIIRPVNRLAEAAREIEAGNLEKQVEVLQYDEIGDLAHAFNNMTAKLSQTLGDLEREVAEHERDLKSLRVSEQRFRQLAENIQEVFWVVSTDWKEVLYVSPAYEQIWGRSRKSLYENALSWAETIVEEDRSSVYAFIESNRSRDFDSLLFPEYRITRPDGSLRWISARGFPVRDESGKVSRITGIAEDITERKIAEAEKSHLEARLRQSQKMKAIGTLAGGIAHDFNNILGIIVGNAELAMFDIPEWNPAQESLKEIRQASLRARDLITQILLFARQKEHKLSNIRVEPIAKESLKMLRASIPTTVEIHQEIQEDLPAVLADAAQIQQIIMNLCTNASQVMEAGGGTLILKLDLAELNASMDTQSGRIPKGRYVRVQVQDTGPGISPENLERIFEPFFTTKGVGEGTGLGLAVVHGIIEDRKGGILVESAEGEGTVFTLYLPASEEAPVDESKEEKPELPKGHERILFVDDEPMIMKLGQRMLERQGYQVETRAGGTDALERFRQDPNRFDLVVTDMTMPGLRGDHLAEELLKIRPDIPVILSTGYSKQISEEKAEELGIRAFVMKPLTAHELARTVRKVLDEKSS